MRLKTADHNTGGRNTNYGVVIGKENQAIAGLFHSGWDRDVILCCT